MHNNIKVLIADQYALTRSGLAALLNAQSDFETIGDVPDCDSVIEAANRQVPDLIIINRNLPEHGYLRATRSIRKSVPKTKVVIVADQHNDEDLRQVIEAGGHGYITSDITPASLFRIFRGVIHGEAAVSRQTMGSLLRNFSQHAKLIDAHPTTVLKKLCPREREVLELLAKSGASNKRIALDLGIAENTVKNHLKAILEKLNVENRVQAATFASQNGFD